MNLRNMIVELNHLEGKKCVSGEEALGAVQDLMKDMDIQHLPVRDNAQFSEQLLQTAKQLLVLYQSGAASEDVIGMRGKKQKMRLENAIQQLEAAKQENQKSEERIKRSQAEIKAEERRLKQLQTEKASLEETKKRLTQIANEVDRQCGFIKAQVGDVREAKARLLELKERQLRAQQLIKELDRYYQVLFPEKTAQAESLADGLLRIENQMEKWQRQYEACVKLGE